MKKILLLSSLFVVSLLLFAGLFYVIEPVANVNYVKATGEGSTACYGYWMQGPTHFCYEYMQRHEPDTWDSMSCAADGPEFVPDSSCSYRPAVDSLACTQLAKLSCTCEEWDDDGNIYTFNVYCYNTCGVNIPECGSGGGGGGSGFDSSYNEWTSTWWSCEWWPFGGDCDIWDIFPKYDEEEDESDQ